MSTTIEIRLPKLGESVMEGTLTEWFKKTGDWVEQDEVLASIGTDKVDSELPSEFAGKLLELCVAEGDTIAVGAVIAKMEVVQQSAGKQAVQPIEPVEESLETSPLQQKTLDSQEKPLKNSSQIGFLSPVVRNMIAELGLEFSDLKRIKATGTNGRLRKKDLLRWKNKRENAVKGKTLNLEISPEDRVETLSRIRKLTADHLQQSFREIPHVTTFVLADVTKLVAFREKFKKKFFEKHNLKLTYTHPMFALIVASLEKFPKFNAWFSGEDLILKKDINLGFATALADGNLMVPNVKRIQHLSFKEIILQMQEKSAQARLGKLMAEDLQKTTFTISNTGIFGSLMGTPIISQPQTSVLALGEIHEHKDIVQKGAGLKVEIQKKMYLSLSYDHRVIDGSLASKFLSHFARSLAETNYEYEFWESIN